MKFKRVLLAGLAAIFAVFPVSAFNLQIGAKVPAILGINATTGRETWFGFFYGGGLNAELGFLENTMFPDSMLTVEAYGMFTVDRYTLPAALYSANAYVQGLNIRYGLNVKLYAFKNAYIGVGPLFIYLLGGETGDGTVSVAFTEDELGHDIGISAVLGYCIPLNEAMRIPIEVKVNFDLTAYATLPIEIQLNVGFSYLFKL